MQQLAKNHASVDGVDGAFVQHGNSRVAYLFIDFGLALAHWHVHNALNKIGKLRHFIQCKAHAWLQGGKRFVDGSGLWLELERRGLIHEFFTKSPKVFWHSMRRDDPGLRPYICRLVWRRPARHAPHPFHALRHCSAMLSAQRLAVAIYCQFVDAHAVDVLALHQFFHDGQESVMVDDVNIIALITQQTQALLFRAG